jgi:hypothetical protein
LPITFPTQKTRQIPSGKGQGRFVERIRLVHYSPLPHCHQLLRGKFVAFDVGDEFALPGDNHGMQRMNEESKEESPTLICLPPGTEEGTIIVGASLDYAPEEVKDPAHWSALALLPLLAKSLISVPHRCTLKLVAFPGREHGMRGATWYVSQLTEAQRKTMRAMVDLDNLGRTRAAITTTERGHLFFRQRTVDYAEIVILVFAHQFPRRQWR